MKKRTGIFIGLCSFVLLAAPAIASAQAPKAMEGKLSRHTAPTQVVVTQATPKERGQLTRQFVNKWGLYVQRVYGVPVRVWAMRMVPNFAAADSTNFRKALMRETFEGAMAELGGVGHRLSDRQAIDRLARIDAKTSASQASAIAAKFGDLNQDLVYTPVQPCRVVDTRNTVAGVIPASSTRSFTVINAANFTAQGGSSTNCGTLGLNATAVALNVTAVGYTASGHAIVYPFGTSLPDSSSLNFNAGNFATNNAIITRIPNPTSSSDFTVWTVQPSHFVVDIVGYFAPPLATALDCATVSGTPTNVNAGAYASLPTLFCAANYTPVALSISAGENVLVADSYTAGNAGQIFVKSLSANAQNVTAKLMCCRVPGR